MEPTSILTHDHPVDSHGYIDFGRLCRSELGMQCQYGSFHLDGIAGYSNLGEGLDWHGGGSTYAPEEFPRQIGRFGSYHDIRITPESAALFVQRMRADGNGR